MLRVETVAAEDEHTGVNAFIELYVLLHGTRIVFKRQAISHKKEPLMNLFFATLSIVFSFTVLPGCGQGPTGTQPVGAPRTAVDGTTFQDMSNKTTTITHPNGTQSQSPKR